MFAKSYSALRVRIVVNVPAPAIKGNAIGTIDAVSGVSSLKSVIPNISSSEIKNIIKDPATANEFISIPIRVRICSPKNRKAIIIMPATIVAFSDWIWPTDFFNEIMIGILPTISMTAKRIIPIVIISFKSNIRQIYILFYI